MNYRGYQIQGRGEEEFVVLKNGVVKLTTQDPDDAKQWIDRAWARATERHERTHTAAIASGRAT